MGFERRRKTFRLDFTGTDLEGLEMDMLGMTISEMLEMDNLQATAAAGTPAEQKQKAIELLEFISSKVVSWNLTENGEPVPVSKEALMELDSADFWLAAARWREAAEGVPAPLEQRSNGGKRWEGAPIPMDMSSVNPPPFSMPN